MAKIVQKWIAEDGKMFDSEAEAVRHEQVQKIVVKLYEFDHGSGLMAEEAAAWILDNFERKAIKRSVVYIDRSGQQYKVDSSIVWMLDGGAWFESGIKPEEAEGRFLAGTWREAIQ